jgi:4-amino-4-deoxy-L-arabinose transferase-like glycosyltransferase
MQTSNTKWTETYRTPVLWLLVASALIRLWGIDYGLPFVYWVDEYHEVMRAMELGAGDFNLARTGKGGFYFLLFFEYGAYFVFLKATGAIATVKEFAEHFARDPSAFYVMGRATAAMFGCATVLVAYHLTRKAYGIAAALTAAIFLAVNVLHVELSHRVGVDVPMTFFVTLGLYYAVRIAEEGRRKHYLLAALAAALAATTKIPGILVLLPLLIAHGYAIAAKGERGWRFVASPDLWISALLFALVLVATNPGILFDTSYLQLFSQPAGTMKDEAVLEALEYGAPGSRPNLYLFYLGVLLDSMGWPLFALAMLSVGYATWRRRSADVLLLSYALVNYLLIAGTTSEVLYFPRYALPILVVVTVLAARMLTDLILTIPRNRPALSVLLVSLFSAIPLYHAIQATYVLTQTDTRTLAKEWFDAEIRAGTKVLVEGSKTGASRLTVPLQDSLESLDRRIASWQEKEPRQARYLQIRRAIHEGGGYELELVKLNSVDNLNAYISRGIEYFVVRPDSFLGSRKSDTSSAVLLRQLRADPRVSLVKRFPAEPNARPGPTLEIYSLVREADGANP